MITNFFSIIAIGIAAAIVIIVVLAALFFFVIPALAAIVSII